MNKRRFDELLERNGIDAQVTLLRKMSKYINTDNAISSYEWADKNKANFSKMVKGDRPFPQDYIIALENVLRTSIAYLFDGEESVSVPTYRNSGIRYAAFVGTRQSYEELEKETTRNGESVLFNSDEYNKMLVDYIIEYQSIQGIIFLYEKYGLYFNAINNMFDLSESHHFYVSNYETAPYLIADLICKNNEGKLFKDIFNGFQLLNCYIDDRCVLLKDKFLDSILKSKNVVKALQEAYSIKFTDVNRGLWLSEEDVQEGLFANPILQKLLERAVEEKLFDIAKDVIDYAQQFNSEQIEYLKANCIIKEKGVRFDEIGNIVIGHTKKGNMINYDKPIDPTLSKEIILGLKKLQQQIEEIKYIPEVLENGSLVLKARIVDGKVLKKSSRNKIEYEMMQFMQERNFVMIPRYLGTEDDVDMFSYIDGKVAEYPRTIGNDALIEVVKFLKEFHRISQERLGYGKTYIHGDLNTKHLVFNEGKLTGVIDWESCSIGNIEDELIDLIFEWTDISSYIRRNERVFETIKNILKTYEADDKTLNDFSDKMKDRIQNRICNLSKDIPNYEYMYETLHHALTFVELYKEKLDSM